jgi:HAD superfamily phosphoserine phosphatase-like hydrolase
VKLFFAFCLRRFAIPLRSEREKLLTAKLAKKGRKVRKQNEPSTAMSSLIDSVLRLRPTLAVFDCDGTLWSGDAGEGFFDWELKRGVVNDKIVRWARARYADYKAGKVSEDDMCGEMVTLHKGLKEADLLNLSKAFFGENFLKNIFAEMRQLVSELHKSGCDVWAVSSTNEWVIREAVEHFGIPRQNVLAAAVEIENGVITDRLIRVPSGIGKPRAILEVAGRPPDAAFGNSRWDAEMLQIARYAVAVNPNPDLEQTARQRGWTVYWPLEMRAVKSAEH